MTGTQNQIEMSALALLHPIVGDISGAPFEFVRNIPKARPYIKSPKDVPLFAPPRDRDKDKIRMTDDSALNLAVVASMMELDGKSDDECVEIFAKNFKKYYHKYSVVPGDYGPSFKEWAKTDATRVARGSFGDGGPMRAPMIGMAYNTLEDTLRIAELSAMPTHGDPEGIKGTQAIAAAVYLARAGCSKDDIKTYIETKFDYDLDIPLSNYTEYINKELNGQAETCPVVVPMAIRAFLESDSYEDCIQKTIFAGGDTDTTAAMTGGIAGAFYGMPKKIETQCLELLDEDTKKMAYDFQNFLKARDTEPNKEELESVMAEARLKKYVLDQYKAGNTTLPKDDPKFVDLLAKKESARLYYEQMKEARQKNDGSEKALAENKDALMNDYTAAVKGTKEFKDKCSSYSAWPAKDVTIKDCEAIKGNRKSNAPKNSKLFPLKRKVVDHALIPEKIVSIESMNKQVTDLFKETVLAGIKKDLNVDDEYFQKIQDMKQKERDRLQRPRRGFWGTVRDRLFGKNNAGRREYDKKVREYEDKVSKLDKEIDESKKMVADAKKQIEDRFNVFKSGEAKDEAAKLKNEEYAAKAMAAVKENFGISNERLKTLLGEDIAKNYIKDETVKKETEVKENAKTEPEKVQSEPEKEGLDPAYFNKDDREELRSQIAGMGFDVNNQRPREEEYIEFKDGETKHFETAADLNPDKEEVQIPKTEVKENVKTEPENKVADNVPVPEVNRNVKAEPENKVVDNVPKPEVKEVPKPEETSRTAKAHYNRIDIINRQANKAMKQISEKYTDESGKISEDDEEYLQELDGILRKDTPESEKMRNIFGVMDKTFFDYFKKEYENHSIIENHLEEKLNRLVTNVGYKKEVAQDIQRELREREKNTNPDADIVFKR